MTIRRIVRLATVTALLGLGLGVAGNTLAGPPEGAQPIFPLAKKAGLTTLAKAVEAAGLQKELTARGPWTVFAPVNDAFADLGSTLDDLLADPDALRDVLLYHALDSEVDATTAISLDGQTVTMVNGGQVTLKVMGGELYLEAGGSTAKVIQTDVVAKNGIVHVIDTVLLQ